MARRRSPESSALSQRVQVAFGKRLKEARRRAPRGRVQQDALAAALDVSRTSVSNIERGRHRIFLDQVYAAARELGVEVADLLPTLEEAFPSTPVQAAPNTHLSPQTVLKATDLARIIQERAARDELPRSARQAARSAPRS